MMLTDMAGASCRYAPASSAHDFVIILILPHLDRELCYHQFPRPSMSPLGWSIYLQNSTLDMGYTPYMLSLGKTSITNGQEVMYKETDEQ